MLIFLHEVHGDDLINARTQRRNWTELAWFRPYMPSFWRTGQAV